MPPSKIFLRFHRLCCHGISFEFAKKKKARGDASSPSPSPSPSPRYSGRVRRKRDSDQGREKFSTGSWNVVRTDVTRTANYLRMFQPGRVGRFLPICIIIARTFESTGIKSLSGSTETIAVDANSFESCKFLLSPFFLGFNWKISFFFFYSFVPFFLKKKKEKICF